MILYFRNKNAGPYILMKITCMKEHIINKIENSNLGQRSK